MFVSVVSKSKSVWYKHKPNLNLLIRTLVIDPNTMFSESTINEKSKQLAPPLTGGKYKGQAGRIGVFGGSLEYTGAPYFAAISSLKVGADLAHVFCMKEAAPVIKSYSPELIVHPYLDDPKAAEKIEPWIERLHVILIGPGLGREESTFKVIGKVIEMCRLKAKPLVIDADGLFYISQSADPIKNYPATIVLTPNVIEFNRLIGQCSWRDTCQTKATMFAEKVGGHVTFLCKGEEDEIVSNNRSVKVSGGGSGRRCGGQGDLLAGSVSTFLGWAMEQPLTVHESEDTRAVTACFAACKLIRACNEKAFKKLGRSMTASDMIKEIHEVFQDNFELRGGR